MREILAPTHRVWALASLFVKSLWKMIDNMLESKFQAK